MNHRRRLVTMMSGGAAPTYTISGTVYDADGSTAVASATVALGALSATSEADGTYTISGVAPGTSGSMTCTKAGYSWTAITVSAMAANLTGQNYTNAWYAAGGSLANALGAYKAVDAANIAASYPNILNPGTHDLSAAVGAPAWSATEGWQGVGTDNKRLVTDITPEKTYTIAVRYTGQRGSPGALFAAWVDANNSMHIYQTESQFVASNRTGSSANSTSTAGYRQRGVFVLAGANVYHNGTLINTISNPTFDSNVVLGLLGLLNTTYSAYVNIQAFAIYDTTLDSTQVPILSTAMKKLWIDITAPYMYQVIQRSGTTGSIAITGTLPTDTAGDVEASFNGGDYATIATGIAAGGAFSGTLSGQAQGQGTLTVRIVGTTKTSVVEHVGIGDVFIVAGQSNASGRATNNQTYSHATLKATLYGNDYAWRNLVDATDSNSNIVDTVSQDTTTPTGSPWPKVATAYMADRSLPIAFVPCAKGGTAITSWLPGANHQDRTTLYGSMVYRALQTGCKAVLWWQGETDVIAGMAQATYNGHLDTIANAVNTDLGVKLMACKLEDMSGFAPGYDESTINAAIAEAWADNTNVLAGPDFSGITPTGDAGGPHFKTDAEMTTVSDAWWAAIEAAFGW